MMKRGKELADDPEFQRRVADGTLVLRGHKEEKVVDTSSFSKQSKISVIAFLVAMVAVVLLGVVKSLRPVLADGSTMGMTDIIQIFMLCAAAVICLVMDKKADAILNCPPFVRQYGILFRKWGVFVCRKRKSKRHIVENSKLKSLKQCEKKI